MNVPECHTEEKDDYLIALIYWIMVRVSERIMEYLYRSRALNNFNFNIVIKDNVFENIVHHLCKSLRIKST